MGMDTGYSFGSERVDRQIARLDLIRLRQGIVTLQGGLHAARHRNDVESELLDEASDHLDSTVELVDEVIDELTTDSEAA